MSGGGQLMGQKNAKQASQWIYMIQFPLDRETWARLQEVGTHRDSAIWARSGPSMPYNDFHQELTMEWEGTPPGAAILNIVLDHAHEFQRLVRVQATSVNFSRSGVFLIPSTRVLKRVVEQLGMYGENFDRA